MVPLDSPCMISYQRLVTIGFIVRDLYDHTTTVRLSCMETRKNKVIAKSFEKNSERNLTEKDHKTKAFPTNNPNRGDVVPD